ncbi:hypothetical protein WMY93_032583 [Mugilogobius chulae]|uniref:Integrase catalytic domain-containing protein n=1 Tax=Mugilogobius chulae TaxID=88201 RepID=A0AAW0MJA3_9GOBI
MKPDYQSKHRHQMLQPCHFLSQSETEVKEAHQPTEQSRYHDDRGSPPRSRSHYQAGESPPRHKSESYDVKPRVTYEKDYDRYADRSSRHEDSSPRARPDSRYYGYEREYSSTYRDRPDDDSRAYVYERRQREDRYPPDPPYPSQHSHMSYSRAAVPDAYHGPKPTIPDFKSEDPREFARLKLALDNLLPYDASEHFKFQILTDHLKCEEALLIADSYSNSPYPFTDTMRALTEMYGQPQQLALKRISNLMNEPNIRPGDIKAFKSFALQVRALVGMLHQLGHPDLLTPSILPSQLLDLADWLEYEVRVQVSGSQYSSNPIRESLLSLKASALTTSLRNSTTILHAGESNESMKKTDPAPSQKESLNDNLLPGPTLGASLLGVLLRFREHPVAISSDVKGMFHQSACWKRTNHSFAFVRDVKWTRNQPSMSGKCSIRHNMQPICATFALQTHVQKHTEPEEDARLSVERCFYVDNCLQSLQSQEEAKQLVNRLHTLLMEERADPQERTLGLLWQCKSDTLRYKQHQSERPELTMRNIYRLLAQQYDPLGYIIPYTTRAKIIVQRLWDKKRGWDDPNLPEELLQAWRLWEEELPHLSQITLPRCYTSHATDCMAYLRTDSGEGDVQVAFLAARSRVAPKKQLSIPRLELCGALTGAQLASVLVKELTVQIQAVVYWTDSTTVLHWLQSDSCRYKVFVGTRVAEVQELTDINAWRYIDSASNPADDITRGKTLTQLIGESRWSHGPSFLLQPCEQWPEKIASPVGEETDELRSKAFCGLVTPDPAVPNVQQFKQYKELLDATTQKLHGAADKSSLTADDYQKAEIALLKYAQAESFPEEVSLLQAAQTCYTPFSCHRLTPSPSSSSSTMTTSCTTLGPERVFAELRRKYWILRGREAVKKHQHNCVECRKWRGTPQVPKMADLPPSRLRLFKPAFYSTGVDCFGPMLVKVGRRTEKRWGILYKCLTTRAIHLDLLPNMDADSFLMSLRRFIARRGKPYELLSDQGTNFKGGSRELREAFLALEPTVKEQLSSQQIRFQFNPPNAPHFGGSWEREVRSVKTALRTTLGDQSVPDEVLRTLLIEVEGILNSRPLGYVSSDLADPDPVTPNCLLMGRPDSSLPQVVYPESELLSRKRWRHSQILADHFWKHFIQHFLPTLQSRQKWQTEKEDITVGTVVLIVDQQTPRALWQVGTVKTVIPGADGRVGRPSSK